MTKARENSDYTGLQAEIVAGDTAARAGRKNLIINGAMQVSQRGDYTTAISSWTNGAYLMDRFLSYVNGVTATFQDMSGSVKYTATSTTSGYLGTEQRIEDYARLANKVITISAEVKSNSSSARLMIYNTAYIDGTTHTGGGGWETLTATITLSGLTRLWYQVWIASSAGGSVSITSGDYIEVRNIQLEEGSVATDFEHRSYGEELALCQRYYEIIKAASAWSWTSSTGARIYGQFRTEKRASPSVSGSPIIIGNGNSAYTQSSFAGPSTTAYGFDGYCYNFTSVTTARPYTVLSTMNFDAEL